MMSGANSIIVIWLILLHLATTSATPTGFLSELEDGEDCFDWLETGDLWQKEDGKACYCYERRVYCIDKGPEELQGDIWQRRDGKFCYFFFDRVYCLENDPECFGEYQVSRYWNDEDVNTCSTRCPILGPPSGGVICEMSKPRTPAPDCLKDTTWINEHGAYCTCDNGSADCRGHPRVCVDAVKWKDNDGQDCVCVVGEAKCSPPSPPRPVCDETSVGTSWRAYPKICRCSCRPWGTCSWDFDCTIKIEGVLPSPRKLAPIIPPHLNYCKYLKDGELRYAEYNERCVKCEHCEEPCHVFSKRMCRCAKKPFCPA